ncbi:hypothetical protein ACFY0G_02210 [Streptomyces sp. NPDC001552]|uniref:hypothetical protein n=1 Tax=Streptomyces sp. NPDC001552 TaxID=3364587 RepID=UPI003695095F
MGAIQEPTPEMGPYRTEIRGESFWLTVKEPTATFDVQRLDDHTMRVPTAHVPYVMASLYQVFGHKAFRDWYEQHPAERGEQWPEHPAVTVTRDGEHLLLALTGKVYPKSWDDEDGKDSAIGTEIPFRDMEILRNALDYGRAGFGPST